MVKTNKALYKHKRTGDLFAIETDESGKIAVKVINHYGDEVLKVYEITAAGPFDLLSIRLSSELALNIIEGTCLLFSIRSTLLRACPEYN